MRLLTIWILLAGCWGEERPLEVLFSDFLAHHLAAKELSQGLLLSESGLSKTPGPAVPFYVRLMASSGEFRDCAQHTRLYYKSLEVDRNLNLKVSGLVAGGLWLCPDSSPDEIKLLADKSGFRWEMDDVFSDERLGEASDSRKKMGFLNKRKPLVAKYLGQEKHAEWKISDKQIAAIDSKAEEWLATNAKQMMGNLIPSAEMSHYHRALASAMRDGMKMENPNQITFWSIRDILDNRSELGEWLKQAHGRYPELFLTKYKISPEDHDLLKEQRKSLTQSVIKNPNIVLPTKLLLLRIGTAHFHKERDYFYADIYSDGVKLPPAREELPDQLSRLSVYLRYVKTLDWDLYIHSMMKTMSMVAYLEFRETPREERSQVGQRVKALLTQAGILMSEGDFVLMYNAMREKQKYLLPIGPIPPLSH